MADAIVRSGALDEAAFITSAAVESGDFVASPDGRIGIARSLDGVAAGDRVVADIYPEADIVKAAGTTFAAGDPVYFNFATGLAVTTPPAGSSSTARCPLVGVCVKAPVTNATVVLTKLNTPLGGSQAALLGTFVTPTVTVDHADTTKYPVVDASQNLNGLMILGAWGKVTEQPAGASEDQLGVSLYDSDDNLLLTLLTSATPDAVGDIVVPATTPLSAASGAVMVGEIPAGKGAYWAVSQATAGSGLAGGLRCTAQLAPLA